MSLKKLKSCQRSGQALHLTNLRTVHLVVVVWLPFGVCR